MRRSVLVRDVLIGGGAPVSVQSMTNTDTRNIDATVEQIKRLEDAGCISSYWGDQSTGARRKYYTITELGKQTYKQKIDEWLEAKRLLDTLLHTDG